MPYNICLITKYNVHINVEICSSVLAVKYLYNYIYKGHDWVTIALSRSKNYNNIQTTKTELINEIKTYLDVKYISSFKSV